jgi:glycosyltransferase involved in cell wall biosynthesis
MSKGISIIIPNFNQADALPHTLQSLANQTVSPSDFETFVVDDGSTDSSLKVVERLIAQLPYELHLLQQDHRGPAAARNRGAEAATREILLFWDGDMIADSQVLEIHSTLHQRRQSIVAGARQPWEVAYTSIFERVTKFRSFGRDQFSGKTPTFWEVFSANLSLAREDFWQLGGFDERLWAFEDTDLAYRAILSGLPLVFSREAIGYHNHPTTLEQMCDQQRRYQRHAAILFEKHPELEGQIPYLVDKAPILLGKDSISLIVRKTARRLVATSPIIKILKALVLCFEKSFPDPGILRFLYWKIIASYQLMGYREGSWERNRREQ